jgi:hypothetical protein
VIVILIHAIVVKFRYNGRFRERMPSLCGVSGTLMLTFNLSIVSAMLAPFHCLKHPNGMYTLKEYPGVLCWQRGQQNRMIISGLFAITFPLAFLIACFWAVGVFPKRTMRGDVRFLRAFCFLFFRFKPEAYWYGPIILVRNCLFALAPAVSSPMLQALFLQLLMLTSLCVVVLAMPWRIKFANFLDITVHVSVIITLSMALVYAGSSDIKVFSRVGVTFIIIAFAMIPFGTMYGTYVGCIQRCLKAKRFQFFLCHHKAGAGAFARLLKLTLMGTHGVRGEVFLDSDNLQDLSNLFSYVAKDTDAVVVLLSGDVLSRPWCVGEITAAHVNRVPIVPVMFPGVAFPSDDFIDNFRTHVPDITSLTKHGVDTELVTLALRHLKQREPIELRGSVNQTLVGKLGECLASQMKSLELGPYQELISRESEVAILADGSNYEAMASALILNRLLVPHTAHDSRLIPHVLPKGGVLPSSVKKLIVLVTTGIFHQKYILEALLHAAKNKVLPVLAIADQDFKFPTKDYLLELRQFLKFFSDEPELVVSSIEEIFTEVGVLFLPGNNNVELLELKACDIFERYADPKRRALGAGGGDDDKRSAALAVCSEPPAHVHVDLMPAISRSAPISMFRSRSSLSGRRTYSLPGVEERSGADMVSSRALWKKQAFLRAFARDFPRQVSASSAGSDGGRMTTLAERPAPGGEEGGALALPRLLRRSGTGIRSVTAATPSKCTESDGLPHPPASNSPIDVDALERGECCAIVTGGSYGMVCTGSTGDGSPRGCSASNIDGMERGGPSLRVHTI